LLGAIAAVGACVSFKRSARVRFRSRNRCVLFDPPCKVTAKLDARAPPPGQRAEVIEALFTFMHLDQV
jgi:hypothetical protein